MCVGLKKDRVGNQVLVTTFVGSPSCPEVPGSGNEKQWVISVLSSRIVVVLYPFATDGHSEPRAFLM